MNAKMPALKLCFERAGFTEVRTLLSSGNVVFNARSQPLDSLQRRAEKAMQADLGRVFGTFVRPAEFLQKLVEPDPFEAFKLSAESKPVITFLRNPAAFAHSLPMESGDASILKLIECEVLSAYVPGPKGGAFMNVLERAFGKDITTRTLGTVRKAAWA